MTGAPLLPSPESTGGAGTMFELRVGVHWLVMLLTGAPPPGLTDCLLAEVSFQTRRLGWQTDDFLLVGATSVGGTRRLVGQVKLRFTISEKNEECVKTVESLWSDFNNSAVFIKESDRLALVVSQGTATLLSHFGSLLAAARASRSELEFENRFSIPGLMHAKCHEQADVFRSIISGKDGRDVTRGELWSFFRSLLVWSLDLTLQDSQTEAMDKALLAFTTSESDPAAVATATWNTLVVEAAAAIPAARTYARDDLPKELQARHSRAGGADRALLKALTDHSRVVLSGIRDVIGKGVKVDRRALVQTALEELTAAQVVVISGPPGSGKSVVAKNLLSVLARDEFTIAFRAQEFTSPHLDAVLNNAQIPGNALALVAAMATQVRKTLLVEGGEKLLESSERSAFTDLLKLVAGDPTWRLILTCRDYSTVLVMDAFLDRSFPNRKILSVPPMTNDELKLVGETEEALLVPLSSPELLKLLRNPYMLDLACRISWDARALLPATEREFRALVWRNEIRADGERGEGLPARRETAFVEIALKRARHLSAYVDCAGVDAAAVEKLHGAGLLITSSESQSLVAPAHDVLEDWAILRWLDESFARGERSVRELAEGVNGFPALRRSLRKWLGELVQRDVETARRLFQDALTEGQSPPHFRDDCIVGLLRSPNLLDLLRSQKGELLANGRKQLQRLVHLLRLACVAPPSWLSSDRAGVLFNAPDGPAWKAVLSFTEEVLDSLGREDMAWQLGVCEDWTRGVSWTTPYPEGAESVSKIAYFMLSHLSGFGSNDTRTSVLKVIAKIPNCDPVAFRRLLEPDDGDRGEERLAEDLQEILYEGFDGFAAVRDMPKVILRDLWRYMFASTNDLHDDWDFSDMLDSERRFGLRRSRHMDFFPPSALRGPFLFLLKHRPRLALPFVIRAFNHIADCYTNRRMPPGARRPTSSMTIRPKSDLEVTIAVNEELWLLYRGLSVGPHLVQSALMAVEAWLQDLVKIQPACLDSVLLHIMKRSRSAALIAVVAGVAAATPSTSGESLLVLLRSREAVSLDLRRHFQEGLSPWGKRDLGVRLADRLHSEERRVSNALPTRRCHLEFACLQLQFGSLVCRVHEVLDEHARRLPPVEAQSEADQNWKIALARMDLRKMVAKRVHEPASGTSEGGDGASRSTIALVPELNDPDIKKISETSEQEQRVFSGQLECLLWGRTVLFGPPDSKFDPATWRQRLASVRSATDPHVDVPDFVAQGRTALVAAVCVRDHWLELNAEEQAWCVSKVCSEIEATASDWGSASRVQKYDISGDRASAFVLPRLYGLGEAAPEADRIRQAMALSLTHATQEVRECAALGVAAQWEEHRENGLHCVNFLAMEAEAFRRLWTAEVEKQGHLRRTFEDVEAEVASALRPKFAHLSMVPQDAWKSLEPDGWIAGHIERAIVLALSEAYTEDVAIKTFEKIAKLICRWWDGDRDTRTRSRVSRSTEAVVTFHQQIERFVVRARPEDARSVLSSVVVAVDVHPEEVARFLKALVAVADLFESSETFWRLWKDFADRALAAPWIEDVDEDYVRGGDVLSALFLGVDWKEGVRKWKHLAGHEKELSEFFECLPASASAIGAFVTFLASIGSGQLPAAFETVAGKLGGNDAETLLKRRNTAVQMESLLQRFVYALPGEVKRTKELRKSVLRLLDVLVEGGSAAAFRMRDDFVTPFSES